MREYFAGLVSLMLVSCSASSGDASRNTTTAAGGSAPTYAELYARFFAPGTAGHCATSGCHDDPGHNAWLCGHDAATCYAGMVGVGLIDLAHPTASSIADPTLSPLTWVNPKGGTMPFDTPGPNAEGRDAIRAWVAAGAPND